MIDPEQLTEARQQTRRRRISGGATSGAPAEIGPRTGSCELTPERCRRWLARHRSDRHSFERIADDEGLPVEVVAAAIERERARFAAESRPRILPFNILARERTAQ